MSYQRGVRPDYTVGTITLIAGDVNFTTTGASLESAVIQGGDTIMTADGRSLIIDGITGQNSGTLIYPCPTGADGTDLPVRIRYQPDGSRFQGAARDLVVKIGSGNIDAIAGLQGYAGAIIKFTGVGAAELVDIADIQMSDPHHNLAELAALAKSSNCFVIMGADGSITLKPISELTDAIENNRLAIAALQSDKFNKPLGSLSQFLRGDGTLQSVVGTVTATDGGAIIQRGSNANGGFTRLADGTQICWGNGTATAMSTYSAWYDWVFPAEFVNASIEGTVSAASANPTSSDNMREGFPAFSPQSRTAARCGLISNARLTTGGTMNVRFQAFGRWK